MLNIIPAISFFLFVFSLIALLRLGFNFTRALFSNPPKPFEMSISETTIYGIFLSYIITYLIFI
jgi:hypothetical protein